MNMSNPKKKLYPEDRALDTLLEIRLKLVELISEIDHAYDYIERCKKVRRKVRRK